METHPSTHKSPRSAESDVEEPLEPEEPLTGTDETIFEWALDQINDLRKPVDVATFLRLRLCNILHQAKVKFTLSSELHRELVRFCCVQLESTFQETMVYVQNSGKATEVSLAQRMLESTE